MRELVYYVAVSLDGFIADPEGGFDAFIADGDHSSAILGDYADALPVHALTALGIEPPGTRFDTVVMGWNTMIPALDAGIASPYPHLRQVVATRQARELDPEIEPTADPLTSVQLLKGQPGLDIWLCGGGQLAGTLLPEIDRLVLKRHPIVFGSGIALFGNHHASTTQFTPNGHRKFQSGVVIEEYSRRALP